MPCPRCQAPSPEGAQFCEECGARLELTCPTCGQPVAAGKKFCRACGAPLPADRARAPSPGSYTPKYLAEKILTSRNALEGERKQVTVLFADMKGSMELLADRDPEEARGLLDPVLALMMEAVHRYEGTVNQVMGDGIMALFGAPLAHEDHAVRACYAALNLQQSVRRYADEVHRREGVPIQIRIGLNSGDVIVRSISSDLHMDYTAVGHTTHLAARMEQMAGPGSILVSASTMRLAESYVAAKPLGPRPVKGLDTFVEVYEITAARAVRLRFHSAVARGLTPFVGRGQELARLEEALAQAAGGDGQVVAVVGEPGVGKSRLYWEFVHSHRTTGWLILESGCFAHGQRTPYLPIIDLLRVYFHIERRDDAVTIRDKVTARVLSLDRELDAVLTALLWLLDVPVDDARWQRLEAPQRRQAALEGVRRLLLRQAEAQPLLLMVEDVHWIDTESQLLLDSLVHSLSGTRILLLVDHRPDHRLPWDGATGYRQLKIDPLAAHEATRLLAGLLGNDVGLQGLKELLIDRTEGNPFFLEESVRTLIEMGTLVGRRGAYELVGPIQAIKVPPTVQAVLAARIDQLSPEGKHLLEAASVIGKEVPLVLLEAIADLPGDALRQQLGTLLAGGFLYEARLFPDHEYRFKHALTHDVAYGGLLRDRRRAFHAAIVGAMETLYGDQLAQQVDRLAQHAVRGEVWDKALVYLEKAGTRAAARSANREAVAYFEQALEVLAHLPDDRPLGEQAIDLHFALRSALQPLGEFSGALDHLRAAEELAKTLGDELRLGRALAYMANHFWWMGDHERAVSCGQRARGLAEALDDRPLQTLANFFLGQAYNSMGDYRATIAFTSRNVAALRGDLAYERFGMSGLPSVLSRNHLTRALAELGEFTEGASRAEEALQIAEKAAHPYDLIVAWITTNDVWLRKGDLHRAIPFTERALALHRTANLPVWFPTIATNLGYSYALVGRLGEAVPLLEQAIEGAARMRIMYNHSIRLTRLGEAYLLAGRTREAEQVATRALELARERGERGHEAWALRLHGEVAAHLAPLDAEAAAGHYQRALAAAADLGMRPLLAHCHLGVGILYRRMGRRREADEHLGAAMARYREMDMGFWLSKAHAEMLPSDYLS